MGVIAVAAVVTLHYLGIHRSAQEIRATALIPPKMPVDVLVVIARPGQEVTMAGTLAALDDAGAQVSVLSLTSGEAQPPNAGFGQERIRGIRADELRASSESLGVESVVIGDYADGQLMAADPGEVTAQIAKVVDEVRPSAILTVGDMTGDDSDSQAVAGYSLAAAQAQDSPVARVWTVTRGDREVEWNAMLADPIAGKSVPEPDVSVRIQDEAAMKGQALQTHGTQSPDLVRGTYPYEDRIPALAYFRFWDREYFALAWGQPME